MMRTYLYERHKCHATHQIHPTLKVIIHVIHFTTHVTCILRNSCRFLAVLLVFNSSKFLHGLTKFIVWHIIGKKRFLAFQRCATQANLSPVSVKGRATIVARHVSEK